MINQMIDKMYENTIKHKLNVLLNKKQFSPNMYSAIKAYLNDKGYQEVPHKVRSKWAEFAPLRKEKVIIYEVEQ